MRPRMATIAGLLAGAGATAGIYATWVERARVRLDRFNVLLDVPGLPPEGVTILHLSDFHFRAAGQTQARKIARLKDLLSEERYDILALTGDLIHDFDGLPVALDLISWLTPRFAAFFVPGNHDYAEYSVWGVFRHTAEASMNGNRGLRDLPALARQVGEFVGKVARNELVRLPVAINDLKLILDGLEAVGVEPLINRARSLRIGDARLWIAGIDDLTEGHPDSDAALAGIPAGDPLLILAHNPDAWLDPAVGRADLVLSGHTHGGQLRLPLLGAAHTQGTHLTRREPAGWFKRGRARMFVSQGVGESIPLRFGVMPQVAIITLRSAK